MRHRLTRVWALLLAVAAIAALALAGPAAPSSSGPAKMRPGACKKAKKKLARDMKRHAPAKVIKRDKRLVKRYCH